MHRLLLQAESVLRGRSALTAEMSGQEARRTLTSLILLLFVFGMLYGAAMGSFSSLTTARCPQIFYAAIKVPLLLLATFALSLPSYFIFNTLGGLREDFGQALRALTAAQAGLTVVLASLAPLTLLWNASYSDHTTTVLFNAVLMGIATVGGQILLRRYYRPLLLRDSRHRIMLRIWGVLYTFVGIQMGWILRPFVADPDRPISFVRADTWGNAYVIVFQMIRHLFVK